MKFTHIRSPFFAFTALLIVASIILSACSTPPAEPAVTEAPAAEPAAPAATEAPATEAPQPEPGEILLSDTFDNNDNKWGTFEEDGYSVQIQDGQMVMKFTKADYHAYSLPKDSNVSNVDISFDAVIQESAQDSATYGVRCRFTDEDNYYMFNVDGDGYYALWKVVKGEGEAIVDWTESKAIKPGIGETNHIRVVCSDSDLELYINDNLMFAKQDTSLTEGKFALKAGQFENGSGTVLVAFDNLEARYAAPLLSESFDNNDNEWQLYEDETRSAQIQDGQLVISVKEKGVWQWVPQNAASSDMDISFDAILSEGTQHNVGYGVACRLSEDGNNYYDFIVSSNGVYGLSKMVNGNYETLIEYTESQAMKEGAGVTNRFRVVCSGSNLALYANGQEVFVLQDTSITTSDLFGLQAGMYEVDDTPILVKFDNVVVK